MVDEKKLPIRRKFKCDFMNFIAIKFAGIKVRKSELEKDAPDGRPIERVGDIVAHAILGGLHHRYARI